MKLSLATTILAAAIPSIAARLTGVPTSVASDEADFQLERKKHGWHAITGLELEMHNVVQDNGVPHLEDPTVVTAFEEAFGEVFEGMEIKWAFIDNAVSREEADGLGDSEGRLGSYYNDWMYLYADGFCRLCPDDFLVTETAVEDTAVTGTTSSFMHDQRWSQVGPLLCDKLKATGEERYAKVDGCSIRPTYASGRDSATLDSKKKEVASVSRKTSTSSGTTKGSITVHSIHPSSSVNVETIKAALTDAYKKVHEDSLFTVTDVTLEREVTFPEAGSVSSSSAVHMEGNKIAIVGDGASSSDEYLTGMLWVTLAWTCVGSGCNNDSTLPGLVLSPREQGVNKYLLNDHTVFDGYFCHNLRISGDASFGEASGCKISFSV